MATKNEIKLILKDALHREIEAEKIADKLMKEFKNNGIKLNLSTQIHNDEIKHQEIVRSILKLMKEFK